MATTSTSAASSSSPIARIFLCRTILLAVNALLTLLIGAALMTSLTFWGYDFSSKALTTQLHLPVDVAILTQLAVSMVGATLHAIGWGYLYGAMTSNIKEQSPILLSGSIGKALAAYLLRSASQQLQKLNETAAIQSALSLLAVVWIFDAVMSVLMFGLYVCGHIASAAEKKRAAATPDKKIK